MGVKFKKFDATQKSTFTYWYYHWKAYNYTAWKLGVWRLKYLLHDIEKPWLKLFWRDYPRVRKWHKFHNKHHIFYGRLHGINKVDWLAAVIDWECSHLTKDLAVRNGREEVYYLISDECKKYTDEEKAEIKKNCIPILDTLGL
jgi:hypothetical protein